MAKKTAGKDLFKPKVSENLIESAEALVDEEEKKEDVLEEDVTEVDEKVEPEKEQETPEQEQATLVKPKVENASPPPVIFEDKDLKKKSFERNVRVCTKIDHTCSIGGKTYHFERGKQVNVPVEVKAILMKANLLMPL